MAKIEANWTEADMQQAEAMADLHEMKMPPDSCTECGDGTEPDHELCTSCEKKCAELARPRIAGDNWRASSYRRRR